MIFQKFYENNLYFFFQCPRRDCKTRSGRVHNLTKVEEPLCLHTYLILKAGLETKAKDVVVAAHEVNREATVLHVANMIKDHFPTATSDKSDFLKNNKKFIEKVCRAGDKSKELLKYAFKQCPNCNGNLDKWQHKTKESRQNFTIP